jgi:hypothetical protein
MPARAKAALSPGRNRDRRSSAARNRTLPETPFRYERPVQTGGSGPRRLAIDVPLLVGGSRFEGA